MTGPDFEPEAGRGRAVLRLALAALYAGVGLAHFAVPDTLMRIMPGFVPWPRTVIFATGAAEIAGAIGLLVQRLRPAAGIGLALYAICVFPANIRHALEGIDVPSLPDSWWYHGPRLALQPVLVWAALYAARVIDWPFRPDRSRKP